jgi:Flp pilus assembly protein TadD
MTAEQAQAALDDADAWCDRGVALLGQRRPTDAEAAYRRAEALRPAFAKAICGLGVALKAQGRLAEAAEAYRRAIRADPAHASAWSNLGNVLVAQERITPALMAYRAAVRRDPDHADAHSNMAVLLKRIGRGAEALEAARRATVLAPDSASAWFNLANSLASEAPEAAGPAYERAIALAPRWPSAHRNYALWLLREGLYPSGFREYEWRWRMPDAQDLAKRLPHPRWTGQPVDGKTVLITAEQGLGDTLQCVRYVPLLAARGARVIVEARPQLRSLLETVPGIAGTVAAGETLDRLDYQIPLFSLPSAFGTTLQTVPAETPYLHPPQALIEDWAKRLPPGRRIGLVWQGNPASKAERGRSFRLSHLAPLSAVEGLSFVSLQKHHGLDQLDRADNPLNIVQLGPAFDAGTFLDTAAIVAGLDLVITCDTAVAHLAGALGRPVWIAMKRLGDWRWMRGRADSPWYPSARLYRQAADADWSGPFEAMARDLNTLAGS